MHHAARTCGLLLMLITPALARAQEPEKYPHAERLRIKAVAKSSPISLDGVFDEATWTNAPATKGFTQQEPDEGKPASQDTEVRFAYDDDALYIAARMYDDKGAAGVRTRLVRRDQINEGDWMEVIFDTYHDHTARTIFMVNPSGVKFDAGQASPNADASWDPVWDVATKIDEQGWTAEFRIPFAQLRFPKDSLQTWGMQMWRYTERLNETTMWSFWGKSESGGPQHFGHLEDVRVGHKRGGVELLPYIVGKAAYQQSPDPGSPFHDDTDYGWRAGGDVKALLTSTLTLDATINPDFGQVEADPAVINLSAFETFFQEKRPFFVSGGGIFGFGSFNCFYCSNVSSMSLFYSRRIGRSPQGSVSLDHDFASVPDNTTILGAAKITGRTAGGLQVGLLNALTASEDAKAILGSTPLVQEVEPLTNYMVGRVKKNYKNGDYTFGAIGTSVYRRFTNAALEDLLPAHAEAAGFDWNMGFKKRTYSFMGNLAMSNVNGDVDAIARLQRSSARYFNRPDRESGGNGLFSDKFDPTLTTLRGYGGYARIAKDAGSWMGEVQTNFRSPGFEVNDLAFLTRADYIWMNTNIVRQWTKPTKVYRRADFTIGAQQQYNYDGDLTDRQFHVWGGGQLNNLWWLSGSFGYKPEVFDDRLTRGGVVVKRSQSQYAFANIDSDSRKRVVVGINGEIASTDEGGSSKSVGASVRFKPATNLGITFSPSYSTSLSKAQFVRRFTDASLTAFFGQRAVFSDIEQKSLSFDTRVSATFTPTLTLEVVLQPFISSGDYSQFKEFVAPRELEKHVYTSAELTVIKDAQGRDSEYVLDPDRNPATPNFTFGNPDFNFRSLIGNAVMRWEYRPGSTLFLVWQQQRAGSAPYGDFDVSRDADALFHRRADNIFLVKVSYWLPR